jgi:hypothetical protein
MKHFWIIILFGIGLISITGCYTQIAVQNDVNEDYYEPTIDRVPVPQPIPDPGPPPIFVPAPIFDPPETPSKERVYKTRNPQTERPSDSGDRERIRDTGGRNNSGGRGGRL